MFEGFRRLGVPFSGSQNTGSSIWGSILGSPVLGNYQIDKGLGFRLMSNPSRSGLHRPI